MTAGLTGTLTLTRFVLRRDRMRIATWVGAIAALMMVLAASIEGLYPTQADLDNAAAAARDNAAAIAFNGPDQALDTVGGQVAFQVGLYTLVFVALMSLFMIGRETRAEEETGRSELVRAMAVGGRAPAAAALIVVTGMNLLVGVLATLGLLSLDLPVAGAVSFGVSLVAVGLVFAGVALVAAQVTENTRVAYGIAGAVLGAAFLLRAIGDIGDGTLSWLSPIGWSQKTRPFAGEQWWPLAISAVAAVGLVVLAARLNARRDVGAGLVPPRPGPSAAAPDLATPLGLAVRMQRGSVIAWSAGLLVIGVAFGSIGSDAEDIVGDSETMQDLFQSGADVTDSFLSFSLLMSALLAGAYAISSTLRLRSEETALRAEPLLATPVSRRRWLFSHLIVALVGTVALLTVSGLATGLTYGLTSGDLDYIPRLLGASLAYTPAVWLLVGLAAALFGLAPRAVMVAWGVLAVLFVEGFFGDLLDLPSWVRDLSPFQQTPQLPGADLSVIPLVVLITAAAALASLGLMAFRQRDVG